MGVTFLSSDSAQTFELTIAVQPADIDQMGHVNNTVYVRWVQDAAAAHWSSLTTEAQRAAVAWVIARHEIDYRLAARASDTIIARTWLGPVNDGDRTFERHTEILRARDQRLLARARTLWCPVDPRTGYSIELPADQRAIATMAAANRAEV
jgi:acyl-CoA thioester hydrolase